MASTIAGTTSVPKTPQVQESHSSRKVSRQSSNSSAANPEDTVTISSQARAAQQASQAQHNHSDAEQGNRKK